MTTQALSQTTAEPRRVVYEEPEVAADPAVLTTQRTGNRICTMGGACVDITGPEVKPPPPPPAAVCEREKADSIGQSALDAGEFVLTFDTVEATLDTISPTDPVHLQRHLVKTSCTIQTDLGQETLFLPGGVLPDGAYDASCGTPVFCIPGRSFVARVSVNELGEMWVLEQSKVADLTDCDGGTP